MTALSRKYQLCTQCVMDTSDPDITFDEGGKCNHCASFESLSELYWHRGPEGRVLLEELVAKIKKDGEGKDYDIVIGVSGGVDSSYLLHLCKVELGLRPIAVHVDSGWNSELAVSNIEKIVTKLGIDLFTHVVDWEEMRDLQLAYLRAGLANQDVPQDHIFPAEVYRLARKMNIHHIANGSNIATESILPANWGYDAADSKQILAIQKQFGTRPLKQYKTMSFWVRRLYFPYIYGINMFYPLNYMPYSKTEAMTLLQEKYDWIYYGGKHYESRWTRFFQSYYLPRRFGYDKRRAHLASLVVTGEMPRDAALAEMKNPPYDPKEIEADVAFVCRKLGIDRSEFDSLIQQPLKSHTDYPNHSRELNFVVKTARAMVRLRNAILGGKAGR
ncbi:MAG: N-acetyl sugar amidotransferase [Caulobacteraceae bacterium]|nr:N-acetyl sugar amidotransferase [Caulobacteraceae bacterium]